MVVMYDVCTSNNGSIRSVVTSLLIPNDDDSVIVHRPKYIGTYLWRSPWITEVALR